MRFTVGNSVYIMNSFTMSIVRQRSSVDLTPYNILSAYAQLKESLQLVSNKTAQNKEIFSYTDHQIQRIKIFNLDTYLSFGIEIVTSRAKSSTPILVFLSVEEQANLFIIEQASIHGSLSRKSIEEMFNSALSALQIVTEEKDSYYAKVNSILLSQQPKSILEKHRQLFVEIKNRIAQGFVQTSLFDNNRCQKTEDVLIMDDIYSFDVFNSFEVARPTLELNKEILTDTYRRLKQIIPKETVSFSELSMDQALICEMISAALCHQINWDFLRRAILKMTLEEPNWIQPLYMATIKTETINDLLSGYEKADRIRAQERAELLRMLGTNFAHLRKGFIEIFFEENNTPRSADNIRNLLASCQVFSNDPIEKKLQLLLQKLSTYKEFEDVGNYCKPTIDYHIIRSFLRRGFLVPKTKRAIELITTDRIREEKTVGAIRKHCAIIIELLSELTKQSIATINSIEWWIGRTICNDESPDCMLENIDSEWLTGVFAVCPFKDFCNSDSSMLSAPNYSGNSY